MAVFTDTITLYQKIDEDTWTSTVISGVQWSPKTEKTVSDRVVVVSSYVQITFPEGTFEHIILDSSREDDVIVKGVCKRLVNGQRGNRIADLMREYPESGRIKSVNDNSSRDFLKNIKVVISQ